MTGWIFTILKKYERKNWSDKCQNMKFWESWTSPFLPRTFYAMIYWKKKYIYNINNKLSGQETEKLQAEIAGVQSAWLQESEKASWKTDKFPNKPAGIFWGEAWSTASGLQSMPMKSEFLTPRNRSNVWPKWLSCFPHEILFSFRWLQHCWNPYSTIFCHWICTETLLGSSKSMGSTSSSLRGSGAMVLPFNWERSKSLELLLINFPGLDSTWRFPIAAIPPETYL